MKKNGKSTENLTTEFEELIKKSDKETYQLKLYVSGNTPQSLRAILNLKKICEQNLKGRYELEIIDLYQKPELAREANLIAAPTLIKKLPLPLRRVIGDMSNADKILLGLDLKKIEE